MTKYLLKFGNFCTICWSFSLPLARQDTDIFEDFNWRHVHRSGSKYFGASQDPYVACIVGHFLSAPYSMELAVSSGDLPAAQMFAAWSQVFSRNASPTATSAGAATRCMCDIPIPENVSSQIQMKVFERR